MQTAPPDFQLLRKSWWQLLTPRRLLIIFTAYAVVILVLCGVTLTARQILLWEIRTNSRQLAELLASHLFAGDLDRIQGPEDIHTFEFEKVLHYFREVRSIYEDVACIYTLRRDPATGRWFYIVDAAPFDEDKDGDGRIDPDEKGAPPGLEFEAAGQIEELTEALSGPTADDDFTTDPWGTFISGYAPIIDPYSGRPVAVLGVDVTRETFEAKYAAAKVAAGVSFVVLVALVSFAFIAYYGKAQALRLTRGLERQIQEKNQALERTIAQLRQRESTMNQELSLAREVQERFLPKEFPLPGDLRFAAEYRACAEIGGDLYDAFTIHERTAGFFIADVVGHGVSAALVTAAVKASVERYRQAVFQSFLRIADLQEPIESAALGRLMTELNRAMREILPPTSFITLQIGVILPDRRDLLLANAGHLPPVVWEKATGGVQVVPVPPNVAIGVQPHPRFQVTSIELQPGDKFISYTDGIIERTNPSEKTYGTERFLECIRTHGQLPPDWLAREIIEDSDRFSDGREPDDDQAVMVIELRES